MAGGLRRLWGLSAEKTKELVDMADENRELLDGTMGPVKRMFAAADIVWGVWRDSQEPNGVGLMLLKGQEKVKEIMESESDGELMEIAIPCESLEEAAGLQDELGEPDDVMH